MNLFGQETRDVDIVIIGQFDKGKEPRYKVNSRAYIKTGNKIKKTYIDSKTKKTISREIDEREESDLTVKTVTIQNFCFTIELKI